MYAHANEAKQAAGQNNFGNISQLLEDLRVRLDDDYKFTKEQMRNIRSQAQDSLYEATRTSFMSMYHDVLKKLRDNKGPMKLTGVFDNPTREKSLSAVVKRTCSSVRNSFRQDIRDSICGDSPATLATFTYTSATKFKRGGPGMGLDVGFTIHNALLRRFAMENPAIIGVEEVEAEDDENVEDGSPEPPNKKRKRSPTARAGGRIPKGKDFWSRVDAFLAAKIGEFGSKNLQSTAWKEYAAETIRMDESLFPGDDEPEGAATVPFASTSTASASNSAAANFIAPANSHSTIFQHI